MPDRHFTLTQSCEVGTAPRFPPHGSLAGLEVSCPFSATNRGLIPGSRLSGSLDAPWLKFRVARDPETIGKEERDNGP